MICDAWNLSIKNLDLLSLIVNVKNIIFLVLQIRPSFAQKLTLYGLFWTIHAFPRRCHLSLIIYIEISYRSKQQESEFIDDVTLKNHNCQ